MNTKAINWKRAGIYLETSIKVLVEGKKRFLRFRISDVYGEIEALTNLDFESKVLHEAGWFSKEDFYCNTADDSKVKIERYIDSLPVVDGVRVLEDTIWCKEGDSFEIDWDWDWKTMKHSKAEMLATGVEFTIIARGDKKYSILSDYDMKGKEQEKFDELTLVDEDKVLYTLHRLSKQIFDYMNKYGW